MNLKVNPRKFSDKIALIKRKEALSNASFHSAIHGINEITVVDEPGGDVNALEIRDNCSNNSYSPDSFTSESTAISFKNPVLLPNDNGVEVQLEMDAINRDTELYNNSHEQYQPQLCRTDAIFRPVSDRQAKGIRQSNIDGYYYQNKNLTHLSQPMSSGSLPNVSDWNNGQEYFPMRPNETANNRKLKESTWQGSGSNFSNGKSVLADHLKTYEPQNATNSHQYIGQSMNDPRSRLQTAPVPGSFINRTRRHGMDHGDTMPQVNLRDGNPPTYYCPQTRDQYLSLPQRPNVKVVNEDYRHSYCGGTTNSSMKYMKVNFNDPNSGNYDVADETLTPSGPISYMRTDNNGFLQTPMSSNVLANEKWRRVASDSSIQNSLKCQSDPGSQHHNLNKSSFERVNSLKREHTNNPYQGNQVFIQYPKRVAQENYNDVTQYSDLPPTASKVQTSLLLPKTALNSENSDSNFQSFKRPDDGGQYMLQLPGDIPRNQVDLPLSIKNDSYTPMEIDDVYSDSRAKDQDMICSIKCDNNFGNQRHFQTGNYDNNNYSKDTHECYWGHSNDADMAYTNEPSPTTKPCENLDPKNVLVDIKADFSSIPEITLNDTEQQRRDSLNWTVEVLKNLSSDSGIGNGELFQQRDRSLSGYQPMVALTEEEKFVTDAINC